MASRILMAMHSGDFVDYYQLLGVQPAADVEAIHNQYVRLAKASHPGVGGAAEKMQQLNEAYATLKNADLRAEYDRIYARFQTYRAAPHHDTAVYDELTHELQLVRQVKQQARSYALKGLAWLVVGMVITAITYAMAEPGGTYVVAWGAVIFGGYQFLRGLYLYFNPYVLLKKLLGDTIPSNYRQNGQGVTAGLKVAAIAAGLIVVLVIIASIFPTGDTTRSSSKSQVQLETSQPSTKQNPALAAEDSEIQALKSQYDQCVSDLDSEKADLDRINNQLAAYDRSGDVDAYNALVPQQNAAVDAYNAKRSNCNNLQSQYNGKVDDYNSKLQSD